MWFVLVSRTRSDSCCNSLFFQCRCATHLYFREVLLRQEAYPITRYPIPHVISDLVLAGNRPSLDAEARRLALTDGMTLELQALVKQCWAADPAARPTMKSVVDQLPRAWHSRDNPWHLSVRPPSNLQEVDHAVAQRRRNAVAQQAAAQYDVFISYRVATDAETARRLKAACEQVGLKTFLDQDDIAAGADWLQTFQAAVRASRIFAPLLSRGGLRGIEALLPTEGQDDHCFLEYVLALEAKEELGMLLVPVAVGEVQVEESRQKVLPFDDFGFPARCPATGWPSRPDGSVRAVMEQLFRHQCFKLENPGNGGE